MALPSQISAKVLAAEKEIHREWQRLIRTLFADAVFELALRNTDLTDHTLKDLAALDYPYARRHPANNLHDDRLIHRQSGTLQEEFRDTVTARGDVIEFVLLNEAPYWKHLRDGTDSMRPRPMQELLQQQVTRHVWPAVANRVRQEFRKAFQR